MLHRREFLGSALASTAMLAATRSDAAAPQWKQRLTGPEFDWQAVAELFDFPDGYIAMNAANLCPASLPVVAAERDIARSVNADPSFENRFRLDNDKELVRSALAEMVGCEPDSIAITRNTSESNCTVINGLNLGKDDEVVLWDQNHESNLLSWQEASKRHGFRIVIVSTEPDSEESMLAPFADAINNRTRVVAFSHVSNMSGEKLPAQKICSIARRHDALSLVDGAQTFAVMPLNLIEMGCDFYTASMHKWLAGPRECGLLYVRPDAIQQVWPSILGHGWTDQRAMSARKFDCLGQQDDARVLAIGTAVELHSLIGSSRIESRIRQLNTMLRERITEEINGVEFLTPASSALTAGITVFRIKHPDADAVRHRLYTDHGISALCVDGGGGMALVRLCPHIYNNAEQIDRVVSALASSI